MQSFARCGLPPAGILVERAPKKKLFFFRRAAARGTMAREGADEQLRGMIRKLKSGEFRLYSRKKNPRTGKRRNLGTFKTLAAAKRHERAVQFFKRH
jgi:hypothetical protein